jgi:hypothetical protein
VDILLRRRGCTTSSSRLLGALVRNTYLVYEDKDEKSAGLRPDSFILPLSRPQCRGPRILCENSVRPLMAYDRTTLMMLWTNNMRIVISEQVFWMLHATRHGLPFFLFQSSYFISEYPLVSFHYSRIPFPLHCAGKCSERDAICG